MPEYKMLVVVKQVSYVFVEADNDEKAEELAWQKYQEDGDDVELLSDTIDITIDEVYE